MTDDTPAGSDAPAPDLSPADEAAVHDLLAALPDPEVPADVEARVNAALAAEAERSGTPGAAPTTSVLIARDPGRGAAAPTRSSRSTRILQVAAGVAVLAVAAGITVSVVSNRGSNDSGTGATTAASAPGSVPVTVSRTAYDDANLNRGVRALVAGSAATTASPASPATTATGEQGSALPTVAASVSLAAASTLAHDPARRATCVAALAGRTDVTPVAVDVGTYDKRAAVVVVLPDDNDPAVLDAWVVGPTCSDADRPFPYTYHQLPRP